MASYVLHGIVGCLATSVAKVPEIWKHSIKQHRSYNKYITISSYYTCRTTYWMTHVQYRISGIFRVGKFWRKRRLDGVLNFH